MIGNSDVPGEQVRGATLIAMDSHGIVDSGAVGKSVVVQDNDSPAGLRDNLPSMTGMTHGLMNDTALVVVELGDFNRSKHSGITCPMQRIRFIDRGICGTEFNS